MREIGMHCFRESSARKLLYCTMYVLLVVQRIWVLHCTPTVEGITAIPGYIDVPGPDPLEARIAEGRARQRSGVDLISGLSLLQPRWWRWTRDKARR